MKIFLTGASGFLGSHIAEELCRRGHEIFALVRPSSRTDHLKSLGVKLIEGALPDCRGLESTLNQVDAVIHGAGIVKALSRREFHLVNGLGTENLVNQILHASPGPRFLIYISSIAVHNPQEGRDFCIPSEQCHPLTHYGASKLSGELALKTLSGKMSTVILRPPVLYGPRDMEILPLVKALSKGIAPLLRDGQNQVSICYVADVATAIADLAENFPQKNEIFCLDDGRPHTLKDLAEEISDILNRPARHLSLPYPLFYLAAGISQGWAQIRRKPAVFTINKLKEIRQSSWVCGAEKISKQIGWHPKFDLKQGMQHTLDYYRREKLI